MGESSSSSSCRSWLKNDVFLSFRGEDTRNKFLSHLDGALRRKKVVTFTDYKLTRGCEISSSLLKAIEESKILVVIFSKDYASSTWCLDELVKIMECKEMYGQIVIPIFYEVSPSDVRSQTGAFGDAFATLRRRFPDNSDKVKRWTDALTKAASLGGWVSSFNRIESRLINQIAKDIWKKLNDTPSSGKEYPVGVERHIQIARDSWRKKLNDMPSSGKEYLVGVERRIESIISLLSIGLIYRCVVGIWGMGGIGKTTLARLVFDKISHQFEGSYFLSNVMEEVRAYGKSNWLQRNMLSIKMLCHKKLLFVLDDVPALREIEFLIELYGSLGLGSRVILTSRERRVLQTFGRIDTYEVEALYEEEALMLFSWYALRRSYNRVDYMASLSKEIVKYARGVPLVLKIFGSSLYRKGKNEWRATLNRLRRSSDRKIFIVLKVIYDGLGDEEKKLFLDIACFLIGEHKHFVETFLNSKGISTEVITALTDKFLVIVSNNKIKMHYLIQQMGWEIARQEYFNKVSGKGSFWWHHRDIYFVLTKDDKGNVSVAGISLDMSKIRDMDLNPCASKKMPILEFYCSHGEKNSKVQAFQGPESTFSELRYFQLHGNPLKSSSLNFHRESLFAFDLPYNNVEQLWNADQVANFQPLENRTSKALYLGQKKHILNPTIEMFSKLVDRCVKQKTTIEVDHEEDIYGDQSLATVTPEDFRIMISMIKLSVNCIDIYIRMLYEQLKDNDMLGQFAFINPASVSLAGGPNNDRRWSKRAQVIARCLQRATRTQLIFMPYNPGFHWILVVIDMSSMTIYYLDSLGRSVDSYLTNIMLIGLSIYHSHNGNQSDQHDVQWKYVQVPMQSRDVECGYYVLRFMKDIIADISLLTENFHKKETFTREEIDEVRCEWATFVSRYI